jgi:type I restriction enzyme M protein
MVGKTEAVGDAATNGKRSVRDLLGGSGTLELRALEGLLWDAACSIRGPVEAPKFKDYILPLIFMKRLSDVFDDELARLGKELGDPEAAEGLVASDHALVRFYLPDGARWGQLRSLTRQVGQKLTGAARSVAEENPDLQGVIDVVDFNATVSGQRIIDDARLMRLIEKLSRHRLGLADVEADIIGRAYEYLLRKFAEGQGTSAGEHFTPKEVGWLIAHLTRPAEGMEILDPSAGSAGLLVKQELWLERQEEEVARPLRLYGQELNHATYAIGKMNMMVHDMDGEMAIGDTLAAPKFTSGGALREFDVVVANPMWNQPDYDEGFYDGDRFDRFGFGHPTPRSADWGWMQHILRSLKPEGRAAVVFDAAAVTRGSGGDTGGAKERAIRARFVEEDLIEAVVLLPEDIFYNTPAQGLVLVLNRAKAEERQGGILLIDASQEFVRERPKNILTEAGIDRVSEVFREWATVAGFSTVVPIAEAAERDYNLNPGRYVSRQTVRQETDVNAALSTLERLRAETEQFDRDVAGLVAALAGGEGDGLPAGWREVPFETVASFGSGRTPARRNPAYWPGHGEEGEVPWVTISDMADRRQVIETKEKITGLAFEEVFKKQAVAAGTLLMSFKLTIGRTAFMGVDGVHNEAIVSIHPDPAEVDARFLYHYLPRIDYSKYQDRAVKGQTLNRGKIKQMTLRLPRLDEQEAIADLLDRVQDLAVLERRIAGEREAVGEELAHRLIGGSMRIPSADG